MTLAENQTAAYYTFTAPAFAAYTFEGYGNIKKYVPSNGDGWSSGNTLEKDEVVLIKVTAAGTLKVTKGEITELKLDTPSKEITLQANESARFVLNTYVRGMYDFRTTDVKGLSVSGHYDDIIDSENRLYFTCATEESNDRITFSITNDGEAEAKFTVTAGHVVPVELTLDKPESVTVQKGRTSILRFKAPERGRYTVSCEGSDVTLNNEYGDDLYDAYDPEDLNYYTYTLNYNGTADSADATVTVKALQTSGDVTGEEFTASLGKDEAKWYAYRVSKTGEYAFTTEAAGVTLQTYYSLASRNPFNGSVIIAEGTVIYIRAANAGEAQDAVIKAAVTELDELKASGSTEISVGQGETKYVTFKAGQDGIYSFNSVSNVNMHYYADDVSSSGVYINVNNRFFIMKNETVFLSVHSYDGDKVTVNVETPDGVLDAETLVTGVPADVSVKEGESQWLAFTAPSDGTYSFYSADAVGDPRASLYAGGCKDSDNGGNNNVTYYCDKMSDDDGDGNNFLITYQLKANQKIYLRVYAYSMREAEYKVHVMRGQYVPSTPEE